MITFETKSEITQIIKIMEIASSLFLLSQYNKNYVINREILKNLNISQNTLHF